MDESSNTSSLGIADAPSWRAQVNAISKAMLKASPVEKVRLLHRLGYAALALGDVRTKAFEAFTLMLKSAVELKDSTLAGLAACGLACVLDHIGQRERSLEQAREAERLARQIGDDRLLALALHHQAQYLKETGQNPAARALYQEIEVIGQQLDDHELRLMALIGMGRTQSMAAAPAAIAYYEKALALARERSDLEAIAVCTNNLADWMINTGRTHEAITLREESLRVSQQGQSREGMGRALIGLAKAYTLLEDLPKARQLLDRGLPMVLSVADFEGDLHSALNLAYLAIRGGDIPRACELYRVTLERSLAAPDAACARFAQQALELLATGQVPQPAILPPVPVTPEILRTLKAEAALDSELSDDELEAVVGGASAGNSQALHYSYPTGDRVYQGSSMIFSGPLGS